jgi:heme A synthase
MLARVGVAGALLTLAVIVSSAYLRLVQLGLGCDAWPSCYGLRLSDGKAIAEGAAVPWIRIVHRLAASAVGVLSLCALALAWSGRRASRTPIAAACMLLVLALLLAVLGRAAGSSLSPAVTLGNVAGGMAMLALFWWVKLDAQNAVRVAARRRGALTVITVTAIALLTFQIAVGVLSSAQLAGRACPQLPACEAAALTRALDPALYNPWHVLPAADTAGRASLQLAHRAGALASAFVLLLLAGVSWRRHAGSRTAAFALSLLLALEFALGAAQVALDLPLAAAVAHNAVAALILMAALGVAFYSKSSEAAAVSSLCQTRTSNQPSGTKVQR